MLIPIWKALEAERIHAESLHESQRIEEEMYRKMGIPEDAVAYSSSRVERQERIEKTKTAIPEAMMYEDLIDY